MTSYLSHIQLTTPLVERNPHGFLELVIDMDGSLCHHCCNNYREYASAKLPVNLGEFSRRSLVIGDGQPSSFELIDVPANSIHTILYMVGRARRRAIEGDWAGFGEILDQIYYIERSCMPPVPGRDEFYAAMRSAGVLGGRFLDNSTRNFAGIINPDKAEYVDDEIKKRGLCRVYRGVPPE